MLIVLPGFDFGEFVMVASSCAAGVSALGLAMTGFLFAPLAWLGRLALIAASLLMIPPSLNATLIGVALVMPAALLNRSAARRRPVQALSG